MFNLFKSSLVLLSVLSLTACLEVKDKSNDKVVDALTEQNKILQEQANQSAQTKTSISLTGVVNNVSTAAKAVNATVKIKTGSTFSEPVAVSSGAFQLDNLPADSDYELVLHSTTGSFMDRTYFGKTRATNSPGKVYQDVGALAVSVGIEYKFKIQNAVTSASITGLTLLANSNVNGGSGYEQYLHKSTYDAATQEYKITVPERLGINVYANLDINNDGKAEYRPENNSYDSYLHIADLDNHNTIYLIDLNVNAKVKVRVSLLDSSLQPITNANINVKDDLNGSVNGVYESATNQYVIDAIIDSNLTVMIPAFSAGGISYSSSSVQITRASIDETKYSLYVSSSRSYSSNYSFDAADNKVFEVVVQPYSLTLSSNLSVIGASSNVDSVSSAFKVFYSAAVELKPNSVTVLKKDVLHVVKGNESSTDLILPGTTLVETINEPVAFDAQLSLGKTLLTVTPKVPLASGYTYSFSVGYLTDLFSNLDVDTYGDTYDVSVKSTNQFSINDIKLDNNNFYTNGAVIRPANTAGDVASLYPYSSSVFIYLPTSVESLKTLTLRKEQVVRNNVVTTNVATYNLVVNGNIYNSYKAQVVSLAYNESVAGNTYSTTTGAAIADGQWYVNAISDSLSDNTSTNVNSVTFTYVLETNAGVVETGTITLPVL